MQEFLEGTALSDAIRHVMRGANRRCAVAFWGKGSKQALFGTRDLPRTTRVICDISMGGTNPSELEALGAPGNEAIRHLSGLHSKVYLSDRGAVVGSANASENGIGFSAGAGLTEAGVFLVTTDKAYARAAAWLNTLFERADVINQDALAACAEAWRRRSTAGRAATGGERRPLAGSLLDAVWADPERFRGVGFVFTSGRTSRTVRDLGSEVIVAEDDSLEQPLLSIADRSALADWPTGHVFSEWARKDVSGWPERFVCAHRGRTRIRYWLYERRHIAYLGDEGGGVVFAALNGQLKRSLGLTGGLDAMARTDAKLLAKIFTQLDQVGHRLFVNGQELAPVLDQLRG